MFSFFSKIYGLFFKKKSALGELTLQKDKLEKQLNGRYEDINKLSLMEEALLNKGKASPSQSVKKQVASEIANRRRELRHQQTLSKIISAQINVLNLEIHNRAIREQAEIVKLPNLDEITNSAVETEEMFENLNEMNDVVNDVNMSLNINSSQEELEILKELGMDSTPEKSYNKQKNTEDKNLEKYINEAAVNITPKREKNKKEVA